MMSSYIGGAIQIAAAGLFIALMIGATLAQLEIWTPKDPRTKNRLWLALLVPLIAFGVSFISTTTPTPSPVAPTGENGDRPTTAPAAPLAGPAAPAVPVPPSGSAPATPAAAPDATTVADVPEAVRDWAMQTLGQRPMVAADADANYPSCVADLRRPNAAPSASDARSCTRALDRYHQQVVISFYRAKEPYDDALDRSEAALRVGGITEDERDNYNFVLAEIDRLNGPDRVRIRAIETRLLADSDSCRTNQCLTAA